MVLEYHSSELDSCEVNDLMKSLEENDKLKNANKDMETKESSMIKEINMLRMELKATNRRINILTKQLQEKEKYCETLEYEVVNLKEDYDKINKWVKEFEYL